MKKVLITGVCGFIGGHTAKIFKENGWKVFGIDRKDTIPDTGRFVDVLFFSDFVDLNVDIFVQEKIDAIVHCAGTSLVGPSIADPGEYYDNNCSKTNLFLDKLGKAGWKGTFVFSSSAATYGNKCEVPIKEGAEGMPVSPYGMSKKMSEAIIRDHTKAYNFKSISLRYFNACGCDPDGLLGHVEDDTHIIPSILRNHQQGNNFLLNGDNFATADGSCIRDYLHVTDIANAHLEAVNRAKTLDYGESRAYNLGTGNGYSNIEILGACSKAVGSPIAYTIGPRRNGDPDTLIADNRLFMSETNWVPQYSDLETIVTTAWNWQAKL
jgi:UDP-glucose 4-epimerase